MAKKELITSPAENKGTERRRVLRVRALLEVGLSIELIGRMMNLTPKMQNHYVSLAISKRDYEQLQGEDDGIVFGSKTEQYYPADQFDELDCWVRPEYSWDDLTDNEKELNTR